MKSNGNSPKRSLRVPASTFSAPVAEFTAKESSPRVHQVVSEDLTKEESDDESVSTESVDETKAEASVKPTKPKRRAYVDPEVSKERRRERNKLLARKSRQKLKTDMDDLKAKLVQLMKENEYLKRQIEANVVPPVNIQYLVQRDFALPDSITVLVKELMSRTQRALSPRKMKNSSFCITNAISKDMPLVYASPGFFKLTGYEMHEIIGHNCRFLQGPRTDRTTVNSIKKALVEGRDITAVILNYRKDGKPFWNQVKMAHLKDQTGRTFLIVGIQTKIKPLPPSSQSQPLKGGQVPGNNYEIDEEDLVDDDDEEDVEEGMLMTQDQRQQQSDQRAMEMVMTGVPPITDDVDCLLLDSGFEFSFPPLPCDLSDMIQPPPATMGAGAAAVFPDHASIMPRSLPSFDDGNMMLLEQSHGFYRQQQSSVQEQHQQQQPIMTVGVRRGLGNSSCNDRLLDFNFLSSPSPTTATATSAVVSHDCAEEEDVFEWGESEEDQ